MINTLEWPVNNPDCNPIKNVSNYMKNKTADEQPTNVKFFMDVIKEAWTTGISTEYYQSYSQLAISYQNGYRIERWAYKMLVDIK